MFAHAPDGNRCLMRAEPVSVSLARGSVGAVFRYRSWAFVTDTLFAYNDGNNNTATKRTRLSGGTTTARQ